MCYCQSAGCHHTPGAHTDSHGMSMSTSPVRHTWTHHSLADELSEILIQSGLGVLSGKSGCQCEGLILWLGSMPVGTGVQRAWPCSIPRRDKQADGPLETCRTRYTSLIWRSGMNISCWLEVHEGRAVWLHHVCKAFCMVNMLISHVRWQRYAVALRLLAGASFKPVALPSAGPTSNI